VGILFWSQLHVKALVEWVFEGLELMRERVGDLIRIWGREIGSKLIPLQKDWNMHEIWVVEKNWSFLVLSSCCCWFTWVERKVLRIVVISFSMWGREMECVSEVLLFQDFACVCSGWSELVGRCKRGKGSVGVKKWVEGNFVCLIS
jgi:hypothetical protein